MTLAVALGIAKDIAEILLGDLKRWRWQFFGHYECQVEGNLVRITVAGYRQVEGIRQREVIPLIFGLLFESAGGECRATWHGNEIRLEVTKFPEEKFMKLMPRAMRNMGMMFMDQYFWVGFMSGAAVQAWFDQRAGDDDESEDAE